MQAIRFFKFLIVSGSLFFCSPLSAQLSMANDPSVSRPFTYADTGEAYTSKVNASSPGRSFTYQAGHVPLTVNSFISRIIAQDHYSKNLSFFCRQEFKLEKAIKIPFRFRLGSLDQCNKIEGK